MTAPVVMVQGTASGVGKSVIAAGLCRLLARRGRRIVPFKAQNMSNNAAIAVDGGEIARSTAVQAAAAGVAPTTAMNPILLKPEADARAQLVVRGRARGSVSAADYFSGRLDLWPVVAAALDGLRADPAVDLVVAEGAGSPAELNLRHCDLANMRLARHAGAAVLLVGEIDRGGIFAQLLGTLDLLPAAERALVRGLIVNRFRGDPALFADGVAILERRSALPVFGVVPWLADLGLAEEDGAVLDQPAPPLGPAAKIRIAVVRLPRIANFDDFSPLGRLPGVAVEYAVDARRLAGADLVVLPGSKATIADLAWLRSRGLDRAIVAARDAGTPILGVCGGYQMLGRTIRDPAGVESAVAEAPGLGLLPHDTIFAREKRATEVRLRLDARHGPLAAARGRTVAGYEIHAGRSPLAPNEAAPLRLIERGGAAVDEPDGGLSDDGLVLGLYAHGLFDEAAVGRALVGWLRERRGLPPLAAEHPETDPHERWADALEAALDVDGLLERCGVAVGTPPPARDDGPRQNLLTPIPPSPGRVGPRPRRAPDRAPDPDRAVGEGLLPSRAPGRHAAQKAPRRRTLGADRNRSLHDGGHDPHPDHPIAQAPTGDGTHLTVRPNAPAPPERMGNDAPAAQGPLSPRLLPPVTLVLGGARAGKSAHAERLAVATGRPVLFVATATPGDAEMADRIAAHRAARPPAWRTIEAATGLAEAVAAEARPGETVLVDCLTLWVSNVLLALLGDRPAEAATAAQWAAIERDLLAAVGRLLAAGTAVGAPLLLVSNEVGLGIVPATPLGRRYRDLLGRVNAAAAVRADRVVLMVAGVPLALAEHHPPAG